VAAFEAWLVFLILVVNVVGELQRKRTLAASRGFLAAARLSCLLTDRKYFSVFSNVSLYAMGCLSVCIAPVRCQNG